jgi:hypothetical protein
MTTTKHFSKLRGDKVNYLVPAHVQCMITACQWATQARDGTVTLLYVDGTTESRKCERDICKEFDGFLPVVGYVQAGRQP